MPPRAQSPSKSAHSSHWRPLGNTQTAISPSAPCSILRLPPCVSQFCAADCALTRSWGGFVVHAASAPEAAYAARGNLPRLKLLSLVVFLRDTLPQVSPPRHVGQG